MKETIKEFCEKWWGVHSDSLESELTELVEGEVKEVVADGDKWAGIAGTLTGKLESQSKELEALRVDNKILAKANVRFTAWLAKKENSAIAAKWFFYNLKIVNFTKKL